jgi:hypothetical protein
VFCTYGCIIQLHFYKYYAALPLCIGLNSAEHYNIIAFLQIFCGSAALHCQNGAEHQNICRQMFVTEYKGAEHRNILIE